MLSRYPFGLISLRTRKAPQPAIVRHKPGHEAWMYVVANTELLARFADQRTDGSIVNVTDLWEQMVFDLVVQSTDKP